MDRSKFGFYVLSAFVFLFAIVIMGINSTYSINGANTYKWDVAFSSVDVSTNTIKEYSNPKVDFESTSLSGMKFEVDSAGDSITYKINVLNKGSVDAKISKVYVDYSCNNKEECNDLEYTLTYEDGSSVERDDLLNLNTGKTMFLSFKYNGSINDEKLIVDNIKLFVNYIER